MRKQSLLKKHTFAKENRGFVRNQEQRTRDKATWENLVDNVCQEGFYSGWAKTTFNLKHIRIAFEASERSTIFR